MNEFIVAHSCSLLFLSIVSDRSLLLFTDISKEYIWKEDKKTRPISTEPHFKASDVCFVSKGSSQHKYVSSGVQEMDGLCFKQIEHFFSDGKTSVHANAITLHPIRARMSPLTHECLSPPSLVH